MLERDFQSKLIKDIKQRFNGCMVIKQDSSYIQGIPDLLVLHKNKWAALECKKESKAKHQPNQDYYISKMNKMSFAAIISPENKEEILDDMERAFKARR